MPTTLGIIGLIIISVAIWYRDERRQDALFVVGGLCLLAYSIAIGSVIFSVLQVVFVVSAVVEILHLRRKKRAAEKQNTP